MGVTTSATSDGNSAARGLALYRKYRPLSLQSVVGQSHVTDILQSSLKRGRISHAYLFSGPRGVGKTSIARILAHEINSLPYTIDGRHLDIIEIDAASNNGVEDMRDLRDRIQSAPTSSSKKIYIIDEVHMLSKPAFNALLKTLEEPPQHIVFILATTDVDKLPATIISRVQQFHFRSISDNEMSEQLSVIAKKESIQIDDDALMLLASRAGGSLRDGIGLLDQARGLEADGSTSSSESTSQSISIKQVQASLGLADIRIIDQLLDSYLQADIIRIVTLLDHLTAHGNQPRILSEQLMSRASERVSRDPALLGLLSDLQTVAKSTLPHFQLLSCLARLAEHNATTSPPVYPIPAASDQPEPLKVAVDSTENQTVALSHASEAPLESVIPVTSLLAGHQKKAVTVQPLDTFDWHQLVEHARKNFVAMYSVLNKSAFELQGDRLIIYTGRTFHKKKLDDPRYKSALISSLKELTGRDITIETVGSAAPLKNEDAVKVAELMGGGEEVELHGDE